MTHIRPSRALAAALGLATLSLTGCSSDTTSGGSPTSASQAGSGRTSTSTPGGASTPLEPSVDAVTAATVDAPVDLVVRPGDDHLWVAERAGLVRRLAVSDDGRALSPTGSPALDLTGATTTDGERGLLGIAFSTDGRTLFVSHTDRDGNSRLVSYNIDGDTVDTATRTVLLAVDQPFRNHNGGHVVLGPDGKLWFGLGDGGAADDPENRAQDPDTLLGKLIRLDPDGGEPEIMVTGIRNPWRFSFDTDGSLWIGDVGQNQWEEIDHLPADRIADANLGWSAFEGTHPNPNVDPDGRSGDNPTAPVFEYSHEGGNCSVTGGFVYRGEAIPSLQGAYLFADYCAGRVRALRLDDSGSLAAEYDLGIDVPTPVSFGADAEGEPYVLSGGGAIVRLVDAA